MQTRTNRLVVATSLAAIALLGAGCEQLTHEHHGFDRRVVGDEPSDSRHAMDRVENLYDHVERQVENQGRRLESGAELDIDEERRRQQHIDEDLDRLDEEKRDLRRELAEER